MRRVCVPPKHKHISRTFVFTWTRCFGCDDEVCLERMWRFNVTGWSRWSRFKYFCSYCAHSKEDVLRCYDVRKPVNHRVPSSQMIQMSIRSEEVLKIHNMTYDDCMKIIKGMKRKPDSPAGFSVYCCKDSSICIKMNTKELIVYYNVREGFVECDDLLPFAFKNELTFNIIK